MHNLGVTSNGQKNKKILNRKHISKSLNPTLLDCLKQTCTIHLVTAMSQISENWDDQMGVHCADCRCKQSLSSGGSVHIECRQMLWPWYIIAKLMFVASSKWVCVDCGNRGATNFWSWFPPTLLGIWFGSAEQLRVILLIWLICCDVSLGHLAQHEQYNILLVLATIKITFSCKIFSYYLEQISNYYKYNLWFLAHCMNVRWSRCHLNSFLLDNWRKPLRHPHITRFETIQQDLKSNNLPLNETTDMAQNYPLWRLLSTFGVTHARNNDDDNIFPGYSSLHWADREKTTIQY